MRIPTLGISAIYLAVVMTGLLTVPAVSVEAKPAAHSPIPAPPEGIYEVDPGERPGYSWSPGFWRWSGTQHVWTSGQWIANRPGYHWMPNGWEQRGDSWRFAKGHWEKEDSAVLVEEEEEELVSEPVKQLSQPASATRIAATPTAKAKKPAKRYSSRPNYRNTRLYPPVVRH